MNTCCFIGHRKILKTENLKINLKQIVESLIIYNKVTNFIFGSKSEFNDFAWEIIKELQIKYPFIKIIAYDCPNELSFQKTEKDKNISFYKIMNLDNYCIQDYDIVIQSTKSLNAGKSKYIARNFEMIDTSQYCIFYYDVLMKIKFNLLYYLK